MRPARDSGAIVLVSRPAESEAQLSFAGLADLLSPVSSSCRRRRSRHRNARRSTSRCSAPEAEPCRPQRRLLGHRGALAPPGAGRRRRRSSLAVDDLHWLDTSLGGSESGFALRRLGRIRSSAAGRLRSEQAQSDRSARCFTNVRPVRLELGPLSLAASASHSRRRSSGGRSATNTRPDRAGSRRERAVCARNRPASGARGLAHEPAQLPVPESLQAPRRRPAFVRFQPRHGRCLLRAAALAPSQPAPRRSAPRWPPPRRLASSVSHAGARIEFAPTRSSPRPSTRRRRPLRRRRGYTAELAAAGVRSGGERPPPRARHARVRMRSWPGQLRNAAAHCGPPARGAPERGGGARPARASS